MKQSYSMAIALALALIVLAANDFKTTASSSKEKITKKSRTRDRYSRRPLGEASWLLQPKVFANLSSGGKRLALIANRLIESDSLIPAQTVSSQNVRVNNPSIDLKGRTQSETSIAANGSNIIVGFNDNGARPNIAAYAFSSDGGGSFAHKRIPVPSGGTNGGDPTVALGPNGEVYYSTLSLLSIAGSQKSIIGIAKSTDGGNTFAAPVDAVTTSGMSIRDAFQDKGRVAADKNSSSPFKGNVYVSWTNFKRSNFQDQSNFIQVSRSTNGGASFEPPVTVSPDDRTIFVQGSMPAAAPNGDLYVAYFDLHPSLDGAIGIVKSTDGGKTFNAPKTAAQFLSPLPDGYITGGNGYRINGFPSVAIDKNGFVQIVFNAAPDRMGKDRCDVFHVRSTDGGATFSKPLRVNDDKTNATQILPSIAASDNGTIGVKWADRRNDPVNDSLTDIYMAISTDGGATFGKNFRITDHNSVPGPVELTVPFGYHGEYDQITASGSDFHLSWSDERNADPDAYFARVPINRDPETADFNISAAKLFDNVAAGDSADFDLNTTAENGFSGSLALSASPAIDGVAFKFAEESVAAGRPAKLTISTAGNAAPGTYLIAATASGGGLTRKTNLRLTVFAPDRFAEAPVNATRSPGNSGVNSGLQVDASGAVHIAFEDDRNLPYIGNEVFYIKSTDGGNSYSTPIKISTNTPLSFGSELALDRSGNVYIVWTSLDDAGRTKIFFSKSTDDGGSFSAPQAVTPESQNGALPSIAIDKNSEILIAYSDLTNIDLPKLFAARSVDGGKSFSAPFQISRDTEAVFGSYAAFDPNGAAYIVYNDLAAPSETIVLAAADDGKTFTRSRIVSGRARQSFDPHIAIDKAGAIYIVYAIALTGSSPDVNTEVVLIKSLDKGVRFSPEINLSKDSSLSLFPYVIIDGRGNANVVWENETDAFSANPDILIARSNDGGLTFTGPANLSANSGASFGAVGGADSDGSVYVAWTDDSSANNEVFVVVAPSLPPPQPDFTLTISPPAISIPRKNTVEVTATINRIGGFAESVTVEAPPEAKQLKIKITPQTATTADRTLTFKLKIKKNGPFGPQTVFFRARDASGRERLGSLVLILLLP